MFYAKMLNVEFFTKWCLNKILEIDRAIWLLKFANGY